MAEPMGAMRKDLVRYLRAARRPGKPNGQAYLASPVPVLGVPVPDLRKIVSGFKRTHKDVDVDMLNPLAASLWRGPTFEEKALAISLLDAFVKILDDASWGLLDRWAGEATGWGLCDCLGLGPIAKIAYRQPKRFREVLGWARSKNPWRRRIAAYALRDFVFAGELDQPFRLLERLVHDPEFWVQRAVGTWLRECWKKDRDRTEAFLRKHVVGLPKVVITVATERAPRAFREELRARRERDAR
jgi:3-methyladenine DNA glycosylase AlkD